MASDENTAAAMAMLDCVARFQAEELKVSVLPVSVRHAAAAAVAEDGTDGFQGLHSTGYECFSTQMIDKTKDASVAGNAGVGEDASDGVDAPILWDTTVDHFALQDVRSDWLKSQKDLRANGEMFHYQAVAQHAFPVSSLQHDSPTQPSAAELRVLDLTEVLENIVTQLNYNDIHYRARNVCKLWRTIVMQSPAVANKIKEPLMSKDLPCTSRVQLKQEAAERGLTTDSLIAWVQMSDEYYEPLRSTKIIDLTKLVYFPAYHHTFCVKPTSRLEYVRDYIKNYGGTEIRMFLPRNSRLKTLYNGNRFATEPPITTMVVVLRDKNDVGRSECTLRVPGGITLKDLALTQRALLASDNKYSYSSTGMPRAERERRCITVFYNAVNLAGVLGGDPYGWA